MVDIPINNMAPETDGNKTSEYKVTWLAMLVASVTIIAQLASEIWLGIDLDVDVNLALGILGISGGSYAAVRKVLKIFVAKEQTKRAAATQPQPQPQPQPQSQPAPTPYGQSHPQLTHPNLEDIGKW